MLPPGLHKIGDAGYGLPLVYNVDYFLRVPSNRKVTLDLFKDYKVILTEGDYIVPYFEEIRVEDYVIKNERQVKIFHNSLTNPINLPVGRHLAENLQFDPTIGNVTLEIPSNLEVIVDYGEGKKKKNISYLSVEIL